MADNALPVDVVQARGRKHLTKEEIERRRATEAHSPDTRIKCPAYLTDARSKREFRRYAKLLKNVGVWSELHADELARYISAERTYEALTERLARMMETGTTDGIESTQRMQDRAYRQAHASASSLGMNITSLCKLVVPKAMQEAPIDDGLDL